jgi:hypothetical protein
MESSKCFICETKKEHKFSECISVKCQCNCVQALQSMYVNNRVEDIKPVHPKFLKIENGKIKDLPSVDKEIAEFNAIRKDEWLPKKKDKRFRKK